MRAAVGRRGRGTSGAVARVRFATARRVAGGAQGLRRPLAGAARIAAAALLAAALGAPAAAAQPSPPAPSEPRPAFRQDVAWSPDGRMLAWSEFSAVAPDTAATWNIWVATSAGTNRARAIANAQWVDWSPDGQRIVYASNWGGDWDLYTARTNGADVKRLTRHPADDRQPAWSPRGDRIAFVSNRDGAQELFVMNADGSNVRRLTSDSAGAHNPAWSADGTMLTWYARDAGGDRLHVASADGANSAVVPAPDAGGIYPAFFPNGRLLYAGVTPAGRKLLSTVATDGSGHAVLGGIETYFARPSRDGRRIAYLTGAWPRSRICVARADGAAARIVVGDPRE